MKRAKKSFEASKPFHDLKAFEWTRSMKGLGSLLGGLRDVDGLETKVWTENFQGVWEPLRVGRQGGAWEPLGGRRIVEGFGSLLEVICKDDLIRANTKGPPLVLWTLILHLV